MSIQNIINVCLAICITLLIYQTNSLTKEKNNIYKELDANWKDHSMLLRQIEDLKREK